MTSGESREHELTAKQRLAVSRHALLLASRQTIWHGLKLLVVQSMYDFLKHSANASNKQNELPKKASEGKQIW
jgi:hypothetical protein